MPIITIAKIDSYAYDNKYIDFPIYLSKFNIGFLRKISPSIGFLRKVSS